MRARTKSRGQIGHADSPDGGPLPTAAESIAEPVILRLFAAVVIRFPGENGPFVDRVRAASSVRVHDGLQAFSLITIPIVAFFRATRSLSEPPDGNATNITIVESISPMASLRLASSAAPSTSVSPGMLACAGAGAGADVGTDAWAVAGVGAGADGRGGAGADVGAGIGAVGLVGAEAGVGAGVAAGAGPAGGVGAAVGLGVGTGDGGAAIRSAASGGAVAAVVKPATAGKVPETVPPLLVTTLNPSPGT